MQKDTQFNHNYQCEQLNWRQRLKQKLFLFTWKRATISSSLFFHLICAWHLKSNLLIPILVLSSHEQFIALDLQEYFQYYDMGNV